MDKIKKILLVLVVVLLVNTNVYANEKDEDDYYGTFKAEEDYLKKKNVSSYEDLSEKDKKELDNIIDKLKPIEGIRTRSSSGMDPNGNYYGDIFVTMDSVTFGFRHGHAGIGANEKGAVVEANPGSGVKIWRDEVRKWMKKNSGGLMRVRGASVSDYKKAAKFAESRVGYRYNLNSNIYEKAYYCSELVYYAWDHVGYNICSKKTLKWYLPRDIIRDDDTYYVYKWADQ